MTVPIPCCVPFCKRTAAGGPGEEIICGKHWMMVAKETRRVHSRMRRKAIAFMDKHPFPDDLTEEKRAFGARLIRISYKTWERVKKEAIEAAGGLR